MKYISTRLNVLYNTYQAVKKELKVGRLESCFGRLFSSLELFYNILGCLTCPNDFQGEIWDREKKFYLWFELLILK